MNKIVIVIVLLSTGCVGSERFQQREIHASERDRILHIARQELDRQNVTLPLNYDVAVENAEAGNEIERSREVYQVSFSFAYRGRKQVVYTVMIDKRSGKIEFFSDSRTAIPSRI